MSPTVFLVNLNNYLATVLLKSHLARFWGKCGAFATCSGPKWGNQTPSVCADTRLGAGCRSSRPEVPTRHPCSHGDRRFASRCRVGWPRCAVFPTLWPSRQGSRGGARGVPAAVSTPPPPQLPLITSLTLGSWPGDFNQKPS